MEENCVNSPGAQIPHEEPPIIASLTEGVGGVKSPAAQNLHKESPIIASLTEEVDGVKSLGA